MQSPETVDLNKTFGAVSLLQSQLAGMPFATPENLIEVRPKGGSIGCCGVERQGGVDQSASINS
jgi:hypothetical protein